MKIFDYVAYNNPSEAARVVSKYGLRPSQNRRDLALQLANITAYTKAEAMKDIASIHPDLKLLNPNMGINSQYETLNQKWANADGWDNAGGKCGCGGYSNVDGQNAKNEVAQRLSDKSELLITGGLVLIGLAMVLKLIK